MTSAVAPAASAPRDPIASMSGRVCRRMRADLQPSPGELSDSQIPCRRPYRGRWPARAIGDFHTGASHNYFTPPCTRFHVGGHPMLEVKIQRCTVTDPSVAPQCCRRRRKGSLRHCDPPAHASPGPPLPPTSHQPGPLLHRAAEAAV